MVYIPKSINKTKLSRSLDYTRSREFIKAVQQVVRNRFSIIKRNLINEFESHPVTVEISGGVNAKNSSGTLGGKGNLFRFIGFEAGSDPISPISQELSRIDMTMTRVKKDGTSHTNVLYPSADDIFQITPLPWANQRSWAQGIEKGISNLGQFLNIKSEHSRAGAGIQVPNINTGSSFQPVPYITLLIKNFEKEIINLSRAKITMT
jgi:hypothetical protein